MEEKINKIEIIEGKKLYHFQFKYL